MKFSLESNVETVSAALIKRLGLLGDADKILRTAALDSVALIQNRVQQEGRAADGSQLTGYSKRYGLVRRAKGRQIQTVDLTYTGDMFRSFLFAPFGATGYAVGFSSRREADKAAYNEARQGNKIFYLTLDEKEFILNGIKQRIRAVLKGQNSEN